MISPASFPPRSGGTRKVTTQSSGDVKRRFERERSIHTDTVRCGLPRNGMPLRGDSLGLIP